MFYFLICTASTQNEVNDICVNFSSVEPFLSKVEVWQKNLSTVNEVLNKWWFVQQKWIYLSEIYGSKEMQYLLPDKTDQFYELSKFYKEVIDTAIIT